MAENNENPEAPEVNPEDAADATALVGDANEDSEPQQGEIQDDDSETTNSIEEEFINPLIQEQTEAPQPNFQVAARVLAANEKVADMLNKQDKQVDISLKLTYGLVILIILIIWIIFVICFSNKQLEPDPEKIKHVSDTVFIALLTTATANIIALPTIILKYLFSNHDK